MLKKLRIKFICITMAIVVLMLCVIFTIVYRSTAADLEAESLRTLETLAADPYRTGSLSSGGDRVSVPYFILQLGSNGEMLVSTGGSFDLTDQELLLKLVNTAFSSAERTGVMREYRLRYLRQSTPSARIVVFVDTSGELATLENLVRTCIFVALGSLVLFLGLSVLLARWAVKPVERAWRQQRQFVADASHELKTPLTVIMTNAELLASGDDAHMREQCTGSILAMSRQMRSLVEALLELARADSGASPAQFESVDMSDLVNDALLPFEPVFFEKGLTLSEDVAGGIRVNGSPTALRQVTDILLDNAGKYTSPGGQVCVALERNGRRCRLSVATTGPEISAADRKNIFKRFYRVDSSRSASGSYGLGLSIAESIVHAHRGSIWCESRGGVNTFFVELPALSEDKS